MRKLYIFSVILLLVGLTVFFAVRIRERYNVIIKAANKTYSRKVSLMKPSVTSTRAPTKKIIMIPSPSPTEIIVAYYLSPTLQPPTLSPSPTVSEMPKSGAINGPILLFAVSVFAILISLWF